MITDDVNKDDRPPRSALRPRVVAGFGRSGTTWVQDVLAESNGLRPIFEPLHPRHNREAKQFAHRYYAADASDPALHRFLDRYFVGDGDSLWTDYRIVSENLSPRITDLKSIDRIKQRLRAYRTAMEKYSRFHKQRQHDQRIVKFIRANMMLSWIQQTCGARIAFIIRHPAAVVMSQLRAAEFWDPFVVIEKYQQDASLQEALDSQTRQLLFRKLDRIEAYALSWCIENSVALRQCEDSDIPVFFYEDLVRKGLPEWRKILAALDLRTEPDTDLVAQPSQQTWGERATNTELVRRYWSWTDKADQDILGRIQSMLDATGISVYRTSEVLPAGSDA
jgi:hypothetical protein